MEIATESTPLTGNPTRVTSSGWWEGRENGPLRAALALGTALIVGCLLLVASTSQSPHSVLGDSSYHDSGACSITDIHNGMKVTRADLKDDASYLAYQSPTGAPRVRLPFSRLPYIHNCADPWSKYLKYGGVKMPNNCRLHTPPASESPFGPGKKVLIAGNSYVFQNVVALIGQYQAHITSHQTYLASDNSISEECKCVWEHAPKSECMDMYKKMPGHAARSKNQDDWPVANTSYGSEVHSPPSSRGVVSFIDGSVMYYIINHPMMNSEIFLLNDIAAVFGTSLESMDIVVANEGNGRGFCQGFCSTEPVEVAQNHEMPLNVVLKTLKEHSFKGQAILLPRDYSDSCLELVDESAQYNFDHCYSSGCDPAGDFGFTVKVVPLHLRMAVEYGLPYMSGDQIPGSVYHKDSYPQRTMCSTITKFGDPVGHDPNVQKCVLDHQHACEPGMADVGVNIWLHALHTDAKVWHS